MTTDVARQLPVKAGWVLALMAGAQFMVVVDETVVNVALPSMATDLHLNTSELSWVVNAYLLLFGGFLLIAGRLADVMGRRRLFLLGLALFAIASAACGLAENSATLTIARAVQGLGAAFMSPTALSILTTTFHDPAGRRRALAVWGALLGIGATAGVLLGGVIVEFLSWPWVFFINVPIAIGIAVGTVLIVPDSTGDSESKIDMLGAVVITAACLLLVHTTVGLPDNGFANPATIVGYLLTAALLAMFWFRQRRSANPLVASEVTRSRTVRVADTAIAITSAALFGTFFMVTLWMQLVQQWTPLQSGLAWAPQGVTVAIVSGLAARLMPIVGGRTLACLGFVIAAIAQLMLLRLDAAGSYLSQLLPALLINAVGLGLVLVPLAVAAVDRISSQNQGVASGLLSTAQQLGGAIGLAILVCLATAVFNDRIATGSGLPQASVASFHAVFWVNAAALALVAALSLLLPRLRQQTDLAALVH
ncbi:MAG: MFS transporter [Actinomycetes bacterium]